MRECYIYIYVLYNYVYIILVRNYNGCKFAIAYTHAGTHNATATIFAAQRSGTQPPVNIIMFHIML